MIAMYLAAFGGLVELYKVSTKEGQHCPINVMVLSITLIASLIASILSRAFDDAVWYRSRARLSWTLIQGGSMCFCPPQRWSAFLPRKEGKGS